MSRSNSISSPKKAGVKHGVVQDKLWLPGMLKLKTLTRTRLLRRDLRVRGEFGYWVFEGDTVPAQRPSWNYRKEDGGGIIIDMLCHWRYVLDNLFGDVKAVSCLGATHIPHALGRSGQALRMHRRRFGLRHLRTRKAASSRHFNSSWCVRVRRDDLLTIQVDGTKGTAVAGLRHCWIQHYGATPAPGLESRHRQPAQLFRRLAEGPGAGHLRQRLQAPVGALPAPRGEGRAVPLGSARRRQGRATRGKGHRVLAKALLGGCSQVKPVTSSFT